MKRIKARTSVRLNAHELIHRAVEDGVCYGFRRRCIEKRGLVKCRETDESAVVEEITDSVMNSLCELIQF